MDTQLGVGTQADNEWAVDRIISHAGSGQEAVFEILWKAGDITWLPYYQIRHLQALDVYLDLLDVEFIGKLPSGKGTPPHDYAQIFLGAMSLRNILPSNFTPFPFDINTDSFFNFLSFLSPCLSSTLPIEDQPVPISLPYSLADDDCHFVFDLTMPLPCVNHPNFERVSKTHYIVTNFGNQNQRALIHVGQIYQYIAFDNYIRANEQNPYNYPGVPVGFTDFVLLYNSVASAPDKFSLYLPGTNGSDSMIAASIHPVTLRHFHITPQQCGLGDPGISSHAQKLIMERFAVEQARKSRIHEEKFIDRENRRQSLFGSNSSSDFDDISSLVAETPTLLELNEPGSSTPNPNHNFKSTHNN